MGRLQQALLERVESFSDRILDVADAVEKQRRSARIVDQISGSGTSVGANTYEADEALSRADFCRTIGIAIKELNETRFWIRLIGRRAWLPPGRLVALEAESVELKCIFGAIVSRTRSSAPTSRKR